MTQTIKIQVPFQGFYGTFHGDMFDMWIEQEAEYLIDQHEELEGQGSEVCDALHENTDWKKVAQEYVEWFVSEFFEHIDQEYRTETLVKSVTLHSPREYNFTNDKIEVEIPMETWMEFNKVVPQKALASIVEKELEPRSGFIPFYSNDVSKWGCPSTWEAPQTEMVMLALIEEIMDDHDEVIRENILIHDIAGNIANWDRIEEALEIGD